MTRHSNLGGWLPHITGSGGPSLPVPPAWMADALCAQTDPEAFYPDKGGSNLAAKKICRRCEVAAECLDYALAEDNMSTDHWSQYGVWGGLTAGERRGLIRERRAS